MNRADSPKKQAVPFGINGQREDILDTTPAGDNSASYSAGYPAITMTLKAAGGLPPKGQNMNQILFELANVARWSAAGAGYSFDSAFSTTVGGYPSGAKVLSSDGLGVWLNTTDANTANPEVATGLLTGWVPSVFYGSTSISGLSSSNVILTSLQAARDRIELAGALTANITVTVPAWRKKWTVINNCTGAFTVTIKTLSGTGVSVGSGKQADLYGDSTNVISQGFLVSSNNLSEIAQAGSGSQAAARNNLGIPAPIVTDKKQLLTAWVNFSVSGGVVTINDSFNVSSVVRTATGRFNIFFTTPMNNSFYCPSVISRRPAGATSEDGICYSIGSTGRVMNVNQFPISINNAASTAEDPSFGCVTVSGGM